MPEVTEPFPSPFGASIGRSAGTACVRCGQRSASGSWGLRGFNCFACVAILEQAEAEARRYHLAKLEAERLALVTAEVAERAAMWCLPPAVA